VSSELINAKLEERRERRLQREAADFEAICKTPAGRRVMWRLLERAQFFADAFDPDRPHVTSYNEGQRSIGKFVIEEMTKTAPGSFDQMCREANSQKAEDAAFLAKITKEFQGD
jgi:hypothetical protein